LNDSGKHGLYLLIDTLGFGLLWFADFSYMQGFDSIAGHEVFNLQLSRVLGFIVLAVLLRRSTRLPAAFFWVALAVQPVIWAQSLAPSDAPSLIPPVLIQGGAGAVSAVFPLLFAQMFSARAPRECNLAIIAGFALSHILAMLLLPVDPASREVLRVVTLAPALVLLTISAVGQRSLVGWREFTMSLGRRSRASVGDRARLLVDREGVAGMVMWAVLICYIVVIPFLFGVFQQISNVENLNEGLFDFIAEAASVLVLLVLLALSWLGLKFSLERLFIVVMPILATGLFLSPLFWDNEPFSSNILVKISLVVVLAVVWPWLIERTRVRPERTFFRFGIGLGLFVGMIVAGQLVSRLVMTGINMDFQAMTLISLSVLWIFTIFSIVVMTFFLGNRGMGARGAQRIGDAAGTGSARDATSASGFVDDDDAEREWRAGQSEPAKQRTLSTEAKVACFGRAFKLSSRETEILTMFASGRSARYISGALVISELTVKTHLRHIYAKADIHNRQDLLDLIDGQKDK
jgi:DNA-binding CsgD family transcriptional regulator